MDLLDNLEALECGASAGDAASSGAGGAGGASSLQCATAAAITSPAKAAVRSSCRTSGGRVKEEPMEDGATSTGLSKPLGQSPIKAEDGNEEQEEEKFCVGCGRSSVSGKCYIRHNPLPWGLPDCRGAWCRDCFNCWRLVYSKVCTLVMFAQWLRKPHNAIEWEFVFVSFLSLKYEGLERVSETMVHNRKCMMEFVFRMLALPTGPFEVMKFADYRGEQVEAGRLISLVSGGHENQRHRELGYMTSLRQDSLEKDSIRVRRPADHSWTGLPSRAMLATGRSGDIEMVKRQFPESDLEPLHGNSQVVQPQQTITEIAEAKTPLQRKIGAQLQWCSGFLESFQSDGWVAIKESAFTPPSSKVVNLQVEAATSEPDTTLKKLAGWVTSLQHGKAFIKKFKEYQKQPTKVLKIKAMNPYIGNWCEFLEQQGIKMAVSLATMRLKVELLVTPGRIKPCLELCTKHGLSEVLLRIPPADALPADAWLRSVVLTKLACDFEELDTADLDNAAKAYVEDLDWVLEKFLPSLEVDNVQVQSLTRCFGVLRVMFRALACPGEVTATEAWKAKDLLLHDTDFTLLAGTFVKNPFGIECMVGLSDLMQRGANDDLADSTFAQAENSFKDADIFGIMVSNTQDGDSPAPIANIVNAGLVAQADVVVFSVLTEGLQHVLEAKSLWSTLRYEEKAPAIVTYIEKVAQALACEDIILALEFGNIIKPALAPLQHAEDDDFDLSTYTLDADWALLAAFAKDSAAVTALNDKFKSGTAWAQAKDKFVAALENAACSGIPCLQDIVKDIGKHSQMNRQLREEVASLFECLATISTCALPADAKTLFQDWGRKDDNAFLGLCLKVTEQVNTLESMESFSIIVPGSDKNTKFVMNAADTSAEAQTTEIDLPTVTQLPEFMVATPLVQKLRAYVQGVASSAVEVFGESCELHGVKAIPPPTSTTELLGKSIPDMIGGLVDAKTMGTSTQAAARCFANNLEEQLPSSKAYDMMQQVLSTSPVSRLDLGTSLLREPLKDLPKDEICAMLDLVNHLHKAASASLFLGNELNEVASAIAQHKVRADLKTALDVMGQACAEASERMEADRNMVNCLEALPTAVWRMNVGQLRSWFSVAKSVVAEIYGRMLGALVADGHSLAQQVEKHTPKYDHFLNDKVMITGLVRKHLLKNKGVEVLWGEIVALFQVTASIADFAAKAGLPDPKAEGATHAEAMEFIGLAYAEAKKTLQATAGARICIDCTGAEQASQAEGYLKKPNLVLPKALRNALEAASKPHAPNPAGSKKRTASAAGLKAEPTD